jgi:hypothetical protein
MGRDLEVEQLAARVADEETMRRAGDGAGLGLQAQSVVGEPAEPG